MGQTVKNKTVLVTGSNRGIGRALVVELLNQGAAKVYATARNTDALNDVKEQFGDRLELVQLDVTNAGQLNTTASKIDSIDILINNAGVAVGGEITTADTMTAAKQEMDVNFFGLMATSQAFTSDMLARQKGTIVNIVSIGGLTNFPFFPTYCASKAAAHSFTQAQRIILGGQGISVHGVYPGPVDTDMAADIEMEKASPESVAKEILEGIGRGDEDIFPDEMAKQFGAQYQSSPKESEQQMAHMAVESQ